MRGFHAWTLLLGAIFLGGCATGPDGLSPPRIRVGGLPYPGLTNYLALAPPHAMGAHRYQRFRAASDAVDEVSLGIVYTRHAGFIDLAHIRSTVDWVRYVYLVTHARLMAADAHDNPPLHWRWLGIDFRLRIQLPPGWANVPTSQRQTLSHASAAVFAQRMATAISTWHEVGSWHGQMILPPIREVRSAFTWDDSASHVLAAVVGGRALASAQPGNPDDWNRAVTHELAAALAALCPVDMDCQNQALVRTRGGWWHGGDTLRRDLDTGLEGSGAKQPWLVPNLPCASADPANAPQQLALLELPSWQALEHTHGASALPRLDWDVTLPGWLAQKVLGCEAGCEAHVFKGEAALLAAIERVRAQITQTEGAQALRPHPLPNTP